VITPMPPTFNA